MRPCTCLHVEEDFNKSTKEGDSIMERHVPLYYGLALKKTNNPWTRAKWRGISVRVTTMATAIVTAQGHPQYSGSRSTMG